MLQNLPIELQLQIIIPSGNLRSLKHVSKHFYLLINTYHKNQLLTHILTPQQYNQIKPSLNQLLKPFRSETEALYDLTFPEPAHWDIIYSLVVNRKVYFNPKTFIIQADDPAKDYSFDSDTKVVRIRKCQSFFWLYTVYLPSGYEFDFQLCLKNRRGSRGLGTTSFRIEFGHGGDNSMNTTGERQLATYPPTYINDMLAPDIVSILKFGSFTTPGGKKGEKLVPVHLVIEEVGMFPKRELEFHYVEFRIKDNWNFLFYGINEDYQPSTEETKFESLALTLERNFYLNMEYTISSIFNLVHIKPSDSSQTLQLSEYDIEGIWYYYYKNGRRRVKMLNPNEQRRYRQEVDEEIEHGLGKVRKWRLPFVI